MEDGSAFFTYYPPGVSGADIDPKKLKGKYYVQLAPDESHLVSGMLHQGERPRIGKWLQVGRIDRNIPGRYFVQYTNFNTLVPGSVVQGNTKPPGKWKEIKKPSSMFHRVTNGDFPGYTVGDDVDIEIPIIDVFNFLIDKANPVIELINPGINLAEEPVRLKMFYFAGALAELADDVSKLIVFSSPGAYFSIQDFGQPPGGVATSYISTDTESYIKEFYVVPETPLGVYSFVAGALSSAPDEPDAIAYYIFFENLVTKSHFDTDV